MSEDLRSELIQVAAVAIAALEDLDYNTAAHDEVPFGMHPDSPSRGHRILADVAHERRQQDLKWGPQHHEFPVWLAILTEEVGEAAQAWLIGEFETEAVS